MVLKGWKCLKSEAIKLLITLKNSLTTLKKGMLNLWFVMGAYLDWWIKFIRKNNGNTPHSPT